MTTISDVRDFQIHLEKKVREVNQRKVFRNIPGIAPSYERSLDEYEFASFIIHDNEDITIRFSHKRSSDVLVILTNKKDYHDRSHPTAQQFRA